MISYGQESVDDINGIPDAVKYSVNKRPLRLPRVVIVGVALALLSDARLSAALVVTTSSSANTLANSIVGPGISLLGTPTYSATINGSSGTFTGGLSAGLGFDSGLILTTGLASLAPGPNNDDAASAGELSPDTTSLTFKFTSAGGDLSFRYVFASEEYNEFAPPNDATFNDKFQFLLNGQNIAKLPSTSTDVSINSVNAVTNPAYFIDNTAGAYNNNLQYDGLTTVLTASVIGLGAGEHTLQLVITDEFDGIYDSAVFVEAQSLTVQPPAQGVPDGGITAVLLSGVLLGFGLLRARSKS